MTRDAKQMEVGWYTSSNSAFILISNAYLQSVSDCFFHSCDTIEVMKSKSQNHFVEDERCLCAHILS